MLFEIREILAMFWWQKFEIIVRIIICVGPLQYVMGIGEQTSITLFAPSSTKDFPQSVGFGRVLSETVLGEWRVGDRTGLTQPSQHNPPLLPIRLLPVVAILKYDYDNCQSWLERNCNIDYNMWEGLCLTQAAHGAIHPAPRSTTKPWLRAGHFEFQI